MIVFLIKVTLSTLFFIGLYQLILAKTAMHKLKRAYLLMCLILPLGIPFIHWETAPENKMNILADEVVFNNLIESIEQETSQTNSPPTSTTPTTFESIPNPTPITETQATQVDYSSWLIGIYVLVTSILLIRYLLSIYQILIKTNNTRRTQFHDKTVVILNEIIPPHNFLHFIFINAHDYDNKNIRESILIHELSHARERHSLDILLVELLRIIFWFNPIYILIGRAMRNNHEYLADRAVIRTFKNVSGYQKLLLGFAGQQFTGPKLASLSNYNLIKKRFIMMKHQTPRSVAILRTVLLIPLFLGSTAFFIIKPEASEPLAVMSTPLLLQSDEGDSKPDISPIDPNRFDFGKVSGQMEGAGYEAKTQSMFDSDWGVDYLGLPGTPVRATASGTITEVTKNDSRFGNFIKIRHNDSTETFYAKLGEISVQSGQSVNKGEDIATIGQPNEIFGRVHYKILIGEKAEPFITYTKLQKNAQKPHQQFHFHLFGIGSNNPFKDELDPTSFKKKLPDNLALENMVFDRKKVIIVKHSGETITKNAEDLNEMQKRAILSIPERPYRLITRKNLPAHIVEKWDNLNYYTVWIDDKRVENSEMNKYTAEDFAHYTFSSVLKHARKPSAFVLYLYTPEYHAKKKAENRSQDKVWRAKTGKLLKESGLI